MFTKDEKQMLYCGLVVIGGLTAIHLVAYSTAILIDRLNK